MDKNFEFTHYVVLTEIEHALNGFKTILDALSELEKTTRKIEACKKETPQTEIQRGPCIMCGDLVETQVTWSSNDPKVHGKTDFLCRNCREEL